MGLKKVIANLKRAIGAKSSQGTGPDNFVVESESRNAPWHARISEFLTMVPASTLPREVKPAEYEPARVILEATGPDQFLALEALLVRRAWLVYQRRRKSTAALLESSRERHKMLLR